MSGSTTVNDSAQLEPWDFVVVGIYFAAVIGVGIWSSCRNRGSAKGYFLAGRSMHWIPVGASLFASNIGSGHFVGLAGSGASTGIGIAVFELSATYVLLLLGWVFVPVYIAAGVFTMPEYLRKRFGGSRIRIYLAVLSLALYIFTKVSADLYSCSVFLEEAIGWNVYASSAALLFLAMLFTVAGGLSAVIWTDFAQTGIMLAGATALSVMSFIEVGKRSGGNFDSLYEAVTNQFFTAFSKDAVTGNSTCNTPPSYSMNIMRPYDLTSDLPWTGVTFGLLISSVWYWCSDQVIVQRSLAAKNMSHAKAGAILAGYLKFTPLWLLVFPGMISRILYPNIVGCASVEECLAACGEKNGCTDKAYPLLVLNIMPTGARGLMIAVMMSALMSSLTSIFNSSSTIFTMDIWTKIRKDATEMELLVVGRVFVICLAAASVAWIPIVKSVPELFHYIQQVTSFLAPPVCAVYVLAVLWKRVNEQGAFWGLMIGLVIGVIRFVLQFAIYNDTGSCTTGEESAVPDVIGKVHYLHFGCILFAISIIVVIVISLLTKPIDPRKLRRLTFPSRHEKGERLEQSVKDNLPVHLETMKEANHETIQAETSFSTDKLTKSQEEDSDEKIPWWRTAINWICGIEKHEELEMSDEEKAAIEAKALSIEEKPLWSIITNVNAVILIMLTTFLWAYFA